MRAILSPPLRTNSTDSATPHARFQPCEHPFVVERDARCESWPGGRERRAAVGTAFCPHPQPCNLPKCLRASLDRFIGQVYGYLLGCRVPEADAMEACVDAWIVAARWIQNGEAMTMTSDYRSAKLCCAAINIVRNMNRRRRRDIIGRAVRIDPDRPEPEEIACDPFADFDPLAEEVNTSRLALLRQCIAALGEEDGLLIVLHRAGLTTEDMATFMRRSQPTASRRLKCAKERLGDLFVACLLGLEADEKSA